MVSYLLSKSLSYSKGNLYIDIRSKWVVYMFYATRCKRKTILKSKGGSIFLRFVWIFCRFSRPLQHRSSGHLYSSRTRSRTLSSKPHLLQKYRPATLSRTKKSFKCIEMRSYTLRPSYAIKHFIVTTSDS